VVLKAVCLASEKGYPIRVLAMGIDKAPVHFGVQSVPRYAVPNSVRLLQRLTAREIVRRCPQVKKQLGGGAFWTAGYGASTVSQPGNAPTMANAVKAQGRA
jgi:putative transposase